MARFMLSAAIVVLTLFALSLSGCGGGATGTGAEAVTPTGSAAAAGPTTESGPEGTVTWGYGTPPSPRAAWDLVFVDPIRNTTISIAFAGNVVEFYTPAPAPGWYVTCWGTWPLMWRGRTLSYRGGSTMMGISFNAQPDVGFCNGATWVNSSLVARLRAVCFDPRG